jgi:N-acetylglucosamine-6-phosphate deacetylase
LEAVTCNPAAILNIDNRVGTLEKGKGCGYCGYERSSLDMDSKVEYVYVMVSRSMNDKAIILIKR